MTRCTDEARKKCKALGKECNPATGRCRKPTAKAAKAAKASAECTPRQAEACRARGMACYAPTRRCRKIKSCLNPAAKIAPGVRESPTWRQVLTGWNPLALSTLMVLGIAMALVAKGLITGDWLNQFSWNLKKMAINLWDVTGPSPKVAKARQNFNNRVATNHLKTTARLGQTLHAMCIDKYKAKFAEFTDSYKQWYETIKHLCKTSYSRETNRKIFELYKTGMRENNIPLLMLLRDVLERPVLNDLKSEQTTKQRRILLDDLVKYLKNRGHAYGLKNESV